MLKEINFLSVIIIIALLFVSGLPFIEQPAAADDGENLDLSYAELPEKGNPKLDSQLNRLVAAETPEQIVSFALESNIDMVGGDQSGTYQFVQLGAFYGICCRVCDRKLCGNLD